jgi:hypothetical protein
MAGNATGAGGGAFRWSPQFGFQMLPGAGSALDVNSSGTVLAANDHVYPLGGPPIAFPTDFENGAFSQGTAISDSNWVSGVWTLQAEEQLPPPMAGAWKIGTDSVLPLEAGEGSQGIDINNAGSMVGQGPPFDFDGFAGNIHPTPFPADESRTSRPFAARPDRR